MILTHILESYDPGAALVAARGIFRGSVELAEPEMVATIGSSR